jgi:hypothetical protein
MAGTITQKTKGKAKERPIDVQTARTKEGREILVPLLVNFSTISILQCKLDFSVIEKRKW